MAIPVLCVLLIACQLVTSSEPYRNGFMDQLSSGMNIAKDFLGSESVALKVAEFVVRALKTPTKPTPDRKWNQNYSSDDDSDDKEHEKYSQEKDPNYDVKEEQSPLTPLRHLVRLFGLQPSQISAVAVNALVFVAQMISTFLAGPKRTTKTYHSEDPSTWIFNRNSKRLKDLIAKAKNESLPSTIDELIREQGSEENTSCIRLLVCKITPFISKMQKTVFGREESIADVHELRGAARMYRHLPTADEINVRNDFCEKQHNDCEMNE